MPLLPSLPPFSPSIAFGFANFFLLTDELHDFDGGNYFDPRNVHDIRHRKCSQLRFGSEYLGNVPTVEGRSTLVFTCKCYPLEAQG